MTLHRGPLTAVIAFAVAIGVATRAEAGQPTAAAAAAPAPGQGAGPAPPRALDKKGLELEASKRKLKDSDVDLTVPESPAFVAIGLSPDTIIRPATPREFATAMLNGVDRQGHFQTGVAVDVVPYLVWQGSQVDLGTYRRSTMTQILSRTSTSFATTKGAGENDPSVKLAAGVHATLFDSEDPRLNNDSLLQCYSEIPVFPINAVPQTDDEQRQLEIERDKFQREELIPRVDECREQFRRKARWNGTSWIVAAATTWVSSTGLAGDLDSGSQSYWSSASYGFDGVPGLREHAQFIGHVRHLSNELVVDQDLPGGQELRDTTFVGGRFRAGTNSFGLSFEAAYLRMTAAGRPTDTATRLAFTAERRLAENLWLNISFGGDSGADPANTKGMSVLSAFKYAFTREPSLTVP
jgi:hypothetical protein